MSSRGKLLLPILALALALLGCNLPGGQSGQQASPTPDLMATLTALAPVAAPTQEPALADTPAPTKAPTAEPAIPTAPPTLAPKPATRIPATSAPSTGGVVPANAARLAFAANATQAVRTGSLAGGAMKEYALRALQGQIMMVSVSSPDDSVVLSVYAPASGDVYLSKSARQATWQGTLPATTDYVIRVTATGADTSYTLQVTIPEVIRFAPGAVSAKRSGPIAAREVHFFSLRALKGQTMTVKITSPDSDVLLTIYGFSDGEPYKRYQVGDPNYSFTLPRTQDYIIEAVSVRDSATTYTVDARVE